MELFNLFLNNYAGDYEIEELKKFDLLDLFNLTKEDKTNRSKSFTINQLYKMIMVLDEIPHGRTITICSGFDEMRIQRINGQFKVVY